MAGQPNLPGWIVFDVTSIFVSEVSDPDTVTRIIDTTSQFRLHTHFTGSGIIWGWLKALGVAWTVDYYADELGVGKDTPLGTVPGVLTAANNYGFPETEKIVNAGVLPVGLYKLSCVVKFPLLHGLIGHVADGPVIEIF